MYDKVLLNKLLLPLYIPLILIITSGPWAKTTSVRASHCHDLARAQFTVEETRARDGEISAPATKGNARLGLIRKGGRERGVLSRVK